MRLLIVALILVFSALVISGQSATQKEFAKPIFENLPFTSVVIDDSTPAWAKSMYGKQPNFFEIEIVYSKWRRENPKVKNGHTRNFKHTYNYLISNDGLDEKGYVVSDFLEKGVERSKQWSRDRKVIKKQALKNSSRSNNNTDWVSIGPEMMYRDGAQANIQANIYAISQSASNPNIVYATSEAGGALFRTDNKGETWYSTSDEHSFNGPREIEVDPKNPEIIYLSSFADIHKSTDGGATWESKYYNWSSEFASIIIHPSHSDTILAAGDERIIKSVDGGENWTIVREGSAYDLKFKPGDPSLVYALINNPITLQTDFYRSTDFGSTWIQITSGWPSETSTRNRGGRLTVSDGFPNIIYAFIGAEYSAAADPKEGSKVLKSSDSGLTWKTMLNYDDLNGVNNGQGFYDWDIEVSDTDTNTVVFGTQGRWLTKDGFATNQWSKSGGDLGHADVQEILINGSDIWIANDGGIIKFTDESFSNFEIKMQGINATSFWSFDQGWNRDAQVGSHYHNGTSVHTDSYNDTDFLSYGGAEPEFSALSQPAADRAWSKGYGSVDGKTIPENIHGEVKSFNYNILPNAEYGSNTWRESEIEVYPEAYNTHYTGLDNVLFRSDNFGISWDTLKAFSSGSRVTKIEIPRANTDVMYVCTYRSSGYKLFKSTNRGESFDEISGPSSFDADGVFLSVDQNDENTIWIARRNGGTSSKIYKSTDGGITWTNLTTSVLDDQSARAIMSVAGTDGGVYFMAQHAVYYKNNSLNDWQPLITNLPANVTLRDIKPYYKEGKIRIAGDARGVWGADLYDTPTTIIPQATVNYVNQPCVRDTFYFDDFSILEHAGASWSWEFSPAPSYIDSHHKRNPKVVFGNTENYQAIMTITKGGTVFKDTLQLSIGEKCNGEDFAGNAYVVDEYRKHATIEDINRTLDAFTYSMWVRPEENQQSTAFFMSKDNGNVGLNYYGDTKNVTIHYPGYSTWAYNTNLEARANEWTHLALTSDKVTEDIILYVNGIPYNYKDANSNYKAKSIDFNQIILGWQFQYWSARWFNGSIDEFCLYDRALSQEEIRMKMHHLEDPISEASLVHYYQFNEEDGSGIHFDKVSNRHASGTGGTIKSTGPYGPGFTELKSISSAGSHEFTLPGATLGMDATVSGEWSVSRINQYPDANPGSSPSNSSYWVIHRYGSSTSLTPIQSINVSDVELTSLQFDFTKFSLHDRSRGLDISGWSMLGAASSMSLANQSLQFTVQNLDADFSQFAIDYSGAAGWIGVKDTAWNDPANWGSGVVPGSTDNVVIPPNTPFQPSVNISGEVESLKLLENSTIRVLSGMQFKVKN